MELGRRKRAHVLDWEWRERREGRQVGGPGRSVDSDGLLTAKLEVSAPALMGMVCARSAQMGLAAAA